MRSNRPEVALGPLQRSPQPQPELALARGGRLELHRDELVANWKLAIEGQPLFRIEPLR